MMPMMLMFITLSLPSGVGIYWVVSNIFSLFASYWVYGRRILSWRQLLPMPMEQAPAPAARKRDDDEDIVVEATTVADQDAPQIEGPKEARTTNDGKRRGKRKKRR
jgi:YidC/Oxa1 family membrane protein insertase